MKLLVDIAGGRAAKGLVDVYPKKRKDTRVVVTRERIEQVLGVDVTSTQVRDGADRPRASAAAGCRRTATSCARPTGART